MPFGDKERRFVEEHNSAAMITTGSDGRAKVARVGVAVIDGKLWCSGTQDRTRTRRLRRDPRCTLFVFDVASPTWLALEGSVTILEGPDAPALNLRLFRQMQGKPSGPLTWFGGVLEEDAFLQTMADEGRLIYELAPERTYGIY